MISRADALKRLAQCRELQKDQPTLTVAADIVDALLLCEFCKGRPVGNAASWLDGEPRPPLPCPRCGKVYEEAA